MKNDEPYVATVDAKYVKKRLRQSSFSTNPFTKLFHCSLAKPVIAPVAMAALRALSPAVSVSVFGFSLRPYTAAVSLLFSRFTIKQDVASSEKKCATSFLSLFGLVAGRTRMAMLC